jgi:hypothetical protein
MGRAGLVRRNCCVASLWARPTPTNLSFVFLRLPSYSTTEWFGDRTGGKVLRLAYYTDFQLSYLRNPTFPRSRVSGCVAIAVLFRSTYSSTQIAIAYMLVMPCPNLKMALA